MSKLHTAAASGDTTAVLRLISKGARPDSSHERGSMLRREELLGVLLVPTVEESLQLRVLERILVEHRAVSVSQEVFGKADDVLVGDLR